MAAPTFKSASAAAGGFLKKNAGFAYGGGVLGGLFVASDLKNILDADNKFKALLKTFKDFVLVRVAMVGVFTAVGAAVKTLVKDTGSLNEALKKLAQIQQYSRQFQSFTGSLNSAKQRVTELYQLSLRRPFKFEDVVEANRSLEIFTRGAYSSVEATQSIGTAAIASGNNIQDTARAVGDFYNQLRAGRPIESAAEQLRQMGLISQSTSDQLVELASSGADTSVVFNRLTDTLEKAGAGAAGYKEDLESVTQAHANAVDELKRAFGAPWTESSVQVTKNQTAAFQAITPVIGRISQSMATLYNGFSTATSYLLKFAAQSKIVQQAGEGLAAVIQGTTVAAGVFASVAVAQLIPVLLGYGAAITAHVVPALTAMGVAAGTAEAAAAGIGITLSGLAVALPVAAIAAFALAAGGAFYALYESQKKMVKGWEEHNKSMAKGTAAIAAQVIGVKTLTDRNEALAKAIEGVHEAEKALADFRAAHPAPTDRAHPGRPGRLGTRQDPAVERQAAIMEKDIQNRKEVADLATKQSGLDTQHVENLIKAQEAVKLQAEERSKGVAQLRQEAEAGLQAAKTVEASREDIDAQIIQKKKSLELDKADFKGRMDKHNAAKAGLATAKEEAKVAKGNQEAENRAALAVRKAQTELGQAPPVSKKERADRAEDFAKRKQVIAQLEADRLQIGLKGAPQQSATFLEARVEQLQAAKEVKNLQDRIKLLVKEPVKNREELDKLEAQLKGQQAKAKGAVYTPEELGVTKARLEAAQQRETPEYVQQKAEEERRNKVRAFEIETELQGMRARRHGDVAGAQAAEDVSRLTGHMEELMNAGFGQQAAMNLAGQQTQEEIAQQYVPASNITSSLQAVGGGGFESQVDPELDSARRREAIQSEMLNVLKILAGQEPDQVSQTTFK